MADTSKVFKLDGGMTPEDVGVGITSWLQTEKGMTAQGAPTAEGYFVQAKSDDDGWTKVMGMGKATQVQIIGNNDMITVQIGKGKWSDKVGAGVVGAFIFAPLMVTAGFGAYKQHKLVDEIFSFVTNFIASGGKNIAVSAVPSATRASASGAVSAHDGVACPGCGKINPKGTKFCGSCGAAMSAACPSCGAAVPMGNKFCPECGASMIVKKICPNCGVEAADGTKFCAECGTALQ